ncbi:MAG: VOC family protein [Pseudomonadota bacterium]
MATQHGDVHWSELLTRDTGAARRYFTDLCGWRIQDVPMAEDRPPYLLCEAHGRPVAGIMDMNAPEFEGMEPCWTTFLHVEDVDAACARTIELGGHVLREPFGVEMAGRIAIVTDPTGAVVGLITPNTK